MAQVRLALALGQLNTSAVKSELFNKWKKENPDVNLEAEDEDVEDEKIKHHDKNDKNDVRYNDMEDDNTRMIMQELIYKFFRNECFGCRQRRKKFKKIVSLFFLIFSRKNFS